MRNLHRLAFTLLAIVCLRAPATSAEPALQANGKPGPVQGFPWLHQGLRLSYKVTDSLDRGDISAVVQNEDGTWLDPTHGGTGVQIAQFTIAGLTKDKVATTLETYLVDLVSGKMIWQPGTGQITDNGKDQLGAGWLRPERIKELEKAPPDSMRASRIIFTAGQRKCEAVFFRGEANGIYTAHIYDLATGLLLHEATRTHVPPTVDQNGFPLPPGVKLRLSTFIGARSVSLPWAGETAPGWVARIGMMQFDGRSVLHALTPGAPEIPTPLRAISKITARSEGWLVVHEALQSGGNPIPLELDSVWTGFSLGDGWVGPNALQRLHVGDSLDKDPVTGVNTSVVRIDSDGVAITQTNGVTDQTFRYDRNTGMLNAFRTETPGLHTEVAMRLTRTE